MKLFARTWSRSTNESIPSNIRSTRNDRRAQALNERSGGINIRDVTREDPEGGS